MTENRLRILFAAIAACVYWHSWIAPLAMAQAGNSQSSTLQSGNALASGDQTGDAAASDNPLATGQSQLAKHFMKLEGILLRSAEIEATSNPTRAALMVQAATLAKEVKLSESLIEAARSLEKKQYSVAIETQKANLDKLNKILELLQSENRSDRVREQRDQIKRTIEETERLLRLQSSLRGRTEGGSQTEKAASDQQKLAEKAAQIAKDLNPDAKDQPAPDQGDDATKDGKPKADSQAQPNSEKNGDNQDGKNKKDDAQDKDDKDKEGQDKEGTKKDGEQKDGEKKDSGSQADDKEGKSQDGKKSEGKNQEGKGKQGDPNNADKPASEKPADEEAKPDQSQETKDPKDPKEKSDKPANKQQSKAGEKSNPSKPSQPSGDNPSDSSQSQDSPSQDSQSQESSGNQGQPQQPKSPTDRAADRLKQAQKRMQEAQKQLEDAERKGAVEKQRQAEQELKTAIEELEEILRQLREEEIERSLTALEERLRLMLQLQNKVLDETKRLNDIGAGGNDRQLQIRANSLAADEKKILNEGQRALLLLREEGSSAAFPESLSHIISDMQTVVDRLTKADVGKLTIGIETDIVTSLEELVAAMSEIKKENKERKENQSQVPGQQGGQPGEQPLVSQLAEMRLIKTLQLRVNKRTQTLSEVLKDPNDVVGQAEVADIQKQLQELAERQASIKQVTRDIVTGKGKQ